MNHCSVLAPAESCRHWTVWEVSCQADATSQSLPICSQKTAAGKMLRVTSKYWKQGRKRDIPLLPSPQLKHSNTSQPTDSAFWGDLLAIFWQTTSVEDLACSWSRIQTSASAAQAPHTHVRRADLSEGHPDQLTDAAWGGLLPKAASSCLGLPCKWAPGQSWLTALVFQTPR